MNEGHGIAPQRVGAAFWLLVGLGFAVGGVQLGFGGIAQPGPGFLPAVVGAILALLGATLLVGTLTRRAADLRRAVRVAEWRQVLFVFGALIAYAAALNALGYVVTTFAFLLFLLRLGRVRWRTSVVIAVLGVAVSHLLFATWLHVPFPSGLLADLEWTR